jgi:hypothetical protein
VTYAQEERAALSLFAIPGAVDAAGRERIGSRPAASEQLRVAPACACAALLQ